MRRTAVRSSQPRRRPCGDLTVRLAPAIAARAPRPRSTPARPKIAGRPRRPACPAAATPLALPAKHKLAARSAAGSDGCVQRPVQPQEHSVYWFCSDKSMPPKRRAAAKQGNGYAKKRKGQVAADDAHEWGSFGAPAFCPCVVARLATNRVLRARAPGRNSEGMVRSLHPGACRCSWSSSATVVPQAGAAGKKPVAGTHLFELPPSACLPLFCLSVERTARAPQVLRRTTRSRPPCSR